MTDFNQKPVVVYGTAGCGKTHNAEKIMKAYGKTEVVDDLWSRNGICTLEPHQLGLSECMEHKGAILIPYESAMQYACNGGLK